jgi:FtsZ-binding cell division protein ZapB
MTNEQIQQWASEVNAVANFIAFGRSDGILFSKYELERYTTLARADLVEAHEECKAANDIILDSFEAADKKCTDLEQENASLHKTLLQEAQARENVSAVRDALRAEVERLTAYNATRTDELAASVKQCSALKAEVESLKADAARWSHYRELAGPTVPNPFWCLRVPSEVDGLADAAMKGTP